MALRRTERSAISSNSDLAREFEHDSKWEDSFGGHDSGYIFKKHSEINNDRHGHYDAGKAENEEHAKILKSGGGKHAVAAAEGGIEKHSDGANARGKDVKAKTFGFFDYFYKQPEYHIEQFYTDEKHGHRFGADHRNKAVKDHSRDLHEAAEWNKQQNRHHSGAFGAETQSHAANEHSNWNHDRHKAYNHEKSQSFAKGEHSVSSEVHSNSPGQQEHHTYGHLNS
ncbi:unnamed protein product [Dracunculus medinensis]|uniref:Hornerin-like n=1 Tax=Dracunculus medinensis TaxID=318479 RepID=A0A0N4UBF4_DRAME|nr:unnamed protein product [Dracunculus medinensis]